MEKTELIEQTELHDSSLIQIATEDNRLRLTFENVWVDDDNCYRVTITLGGVHKVTRNHQVVRSLGMEGKYAHVLEFSRSGHTAALAVYWCSFAPRKDEFCSYEFDFDTFGLQAEKQEQAEGK